MEDGCAGVLAERISKGGPISFRDFMETALYDPANGYYSAHAAIGEGGDFVTAPTISPLFARAVARVFAADAGHFKGPIVFLEAAAAAGEFLSDFRKALEELDPALSARTRLRALERSARGRERLAKVGDVERVFRDASEIEPESVSGWIFSNELYDALPVHRVQMREGKLLELGVTLSAGPIAEHSTRSFSWTSWPAPQELPDYLARFGVELGEGQIAEINLDAGPLHRALCRLIRKGRIATFDYGHRARILYHPHARPRGTLAVHSGGRRGGDPLASPGLVDLTAHVNWNDLIAAGDAEGFTSEGIGRLSRFLIEAGLFEDAARDKLSALRLLDPDGLGETLSVLVQSKNVAAREVLIPGESLPIGSS